MESIRAFIAGIILPSIVLPFGLLALNSMGKHEVVGMASIHAIPLVER